MEGTAFFPGLYLLCKHCLRNRYESHNILRKVTELPTHLCLSFPPPERQNSKRREGRHSTGFKIHLALNPGFHCPSVRLCVKQLSSQSLTSPNSPLWVLLLVSKERACGRESGHILTSFLLMSTTPSTALPAQSRIPHPVGWARVVSFPKWYSKVVNRQESSTTY